VTRGFLLLLAGQPFINNMLCCTGTYASAERRYDCTPCHSKLPCYHLNILKLWPRTSTATAPTILQQLAMLTRNRDGEGCLQSKSSKSVRIRPFHGWTIWSPLSNLSAMVLWLSRFRIFILRPPLFLTYWRQYRYTSSYLNKRLRTLRPKLANQNVEDFQELANKLVTIIVTLRTTLITHCSRDDTPSSFLSECNKFIECVFSFLLFRTASNLSFFHLSMLLKMSNDLNQFTRKNKSWSRYFKSVAIRDSIARWNRQIDEQRTNFIVRQSLYVIDALSSALLQ
jgi:hypothetical protein